MAHVFNNSGYLYWTLLLFFLIPSAYSRPDTDDNCIFSTTALAEMEQLFAEIKKLDAEYMEKVTVLVGNHLQPLEFQNRYQPLRAEHRKTMAEKRKHLRDLKARLAGKSGIPKSLRAVFGRGDAPLPEAAAHEIEMAFAEAPETDALKALVAKQKLKASPEQIWEACSYLSTSQRYPLALHLLGKSDSEIHRLLGIPAEDVKRTVGQAANALARHKLALTERITDPETYLAETFRKGFRFAPDQLHLMAWDLGGNVGRVFELMLQGRTVGEIAMDLSRNGEIVTNEDVQRFAKLARLQYRDRLKAESTEPPGYIMERLLPENEADVRLMLSRLDEPYRDLLELRLEGVRRHEVAEEMGVSWAEVVKWEKIAMLQMVSRLRGMRYKDPNAWIASNFKGVSLDDFWAAVGQLSPRNQTLVKAMLIDKKSVTEAMAQISTPEDRFDNIWTVIRRDIRKKLKEEE